ncbi:MAG: hypothetical protein A3H27_16170 [Acidobacteria bacterium RIFCSPLOWO2_02_FULL_59_13]|nr:MAG: hypothetical protein A3H27_16170 [Acidobacteria bacterium RIFCSPLOWO2_02_FULL_59_13]
MPETFSDDNELIRDYNVRRSLYADFAVTLESLVSRVLKEGGINIHSVTHRVKTVESLNRKLGQEGSRYAALPDITDLAGVRVTTYFHDDVDKAAQLIEREFQIDAANSVDKRSLLDPDRFGYLSLHYVLALSPNRVALPEYRRFENVKAEIQLRSLLQHVWAEIEHDLGYKSARSVPAIIRRRFARLAGLLEIADAEFVTIRGQLSEYEREVPQRIETEPETVALDRASLLAFLRENEILKRLDAAFASYLGASIEPASDTVVNIYLNTLNFLGIGTIAALEAALRKNEDAINKFAKLWHRNKRNDYIFDGLSLFDLMRVILAKEGSRGRIAEWYKSTFSKDPGELPEQIIETARKAGIIT